MPIAFVTVKVPDGGLVHLDVDLKTRVEEFRSIIAPKTGVKKHRQRLVFAGRLMQDGRTLEAYGIERNSTIHLLHGSAAGEDDIGGYDISTIPPQLAAVQRHVLANPDILQQMLESPAMQSLLNDQEFLRSLLKMDPNLNKLLQCCPALQTMLHDPEFMKQATEALRNPVHVRDVLRSTDRSISHLDEKLKGGGFDVLRSMCEDIDRPKQDEAYQREQAKLQEIAKLKEEQKRKKKAEEEGEDVDAEEEGEEGSKAEGDQGKRAPEWVGSFDTNAMASMMQDQNMQQLLSQMVQSLGGPTAKPHPDDPFIDPGFLGQMFHSQTIESMTFLQESIAKLSLAPDPSEGVQKPKKKAGAKASAKAAAEPAKDVDNTLPGDSPAVLSGLNSASPAANLKDAFSLFLQAELESPEVRYKGQLSAMANMGFTDKEACIQALHSHDGNMNKAVEFLMANQAAQK
jgi:ubiquilin|mmetsp:Transcript_62801/g.99597  ORF Transcript_62801/g.99597 Transcript_62801/m.99597 type:complete len:457 (-) Transcript_62801:105-1475(-)|eukprot:CAMPEP_0169152572 /NCGR_PEP_ID=MMETSP1015-20121227/51582_1 /TAXON_ID=342587 /ORGANISM="Karlodinium micrum, Strain CCMP2283" /LENGTH=456 /DNA_ID=CAMNT_0009222369 /DNA_START=90 /DNA_END=1460 /DNA_ORIENTATION=+